MSRFAAFQFTAMSSFVTSSSYMAKETTVPDSFYLSYSGDNFVEDIIACLNDYYHKPSTQSVGPFFSLYR